MNIINAKIDGKIQNITIENGKIAELTDSTPKGENLDAKGNLVVAGLIDVHTHGIMGYDTMDADFEPMCVNYAKFGTTSFLPTTMTMGFDDIYKVTHAKTDFKGANILGFHLEGPYISVNRKGAQNEKYIKAPRIEEFNKFKDVKMITVAPEVNGCMEFIRQIKDRTVVSVGHTDCDYDTAIRAINEGANCLTHTFNAMPPLHHREPGPIGAGAQKHIYAQIICDGLHIHKAVVLAAYKMFGADRLCLISDSIRPAKLKDGEYESGGLPVFVKDNSIRLKDGTLAGGYNCLLDCVKSAIEFGIPEKDAFKMASETPAKMLNIKKGQIKKDYDADLLILDNNYDIKKVIVGGKVFE